MRKIWLWVLCSAVCLLLFACGGGGGSTSTKDKGGANALFLAVKNTTPAFKSTVSAAPKNKTVSSIASAPTFTDPAMNLAFQLLRDYSYPADEGKVDMTNIYKVLYEAGGYLSDAKSICSSMTTTTGSAVSSYAFSDFLGHSYDCGGTRAESGGYGNSVAYGESGSDQYMLATYKWAPDSAQQITIGAIEAHLNLSTGNVELTFAQTVNYPPGSSMGGSPGSGFATRTFIAGNSATHAFELKIAMANSGGYSQSLVGKGVSQGSGQYFLIRNGTDYYCLPAGATETDLMSITPTPEVGVSTDCSGYVAGVKAITPYDTGNPAHIPDIDLSSFDLGVGGTPFKYLMF